MLWRATGSPLKHGCFSSATLSCFSPLQVLLMLYFGFSGWKSNFLQLLSYSSLTNMDSCFFSWTFPVFRRVALRFLSRLFDLNVSLLQASRLLCSCSKSQSSWLGTSNIFCLWAEFSSFRSFWSFPLFHWQLSGLLSVSSWNSWLN